jgi:ketosteroid isomerase-like protein
MDHEALATRLDRVESELAIRRLVHEYCHGADRRDLDRFAAIWDDAAVWAPNPGHPFTGINAIRAAATAQWAAFRQMHHLTANLVVILDGDRATGEADVDVCVQMQTAPGCGAEAPTATYMSAGTADGGSPTATAPPATTSTPCHRASGHRPRSPSTPAPGTCRAPTRGLEI